MDWVAVRNKLEELFRKYKYVLLILALGMILMLLPESADKEQNAVPAAEVPVRSMSVELETILASIEGVGKVRVMLTESAGGETIYQTDEDRNVSSDTESVRIDTVIVNRSDRTEQGLVKQVNPPLYMGAIVVCQGADRPSVQLSVVEAVSSVTGISTDRITVLKMK